MNLTQFTLKNNRTVLVLYAVLLLVGLSTYFNIGRLEYPEFTIRNSQIITEYPGRSALEVEQEVTNALEQSIRQMPELEEITSISKPGLSILSVSLQEKYFDLQPIWQDMRNLILATRLPDGARTPRVNDSFGDVFPYLFALRGDGYSDAELLDYAEDFRDRLMATPGVGKVEIHGEQNERIYLEFSSSELAAQNINPQQLIRALQNQNAIAASGSVLAGIERIKLITLGEFESIEEIEDYRLSIPGASSSLRVSDVAKVRRDYVDPPSSFVRFNGEPVICVAASMVEGEAVTQVGARILEGIDAFQSALPLGLEIETLFYQPRYVSQSIKDFVVNLGQAFFFVVVVMFLFAGFRLAMIVGVLVPSAILMAFAFMPSLGVQLEMMSIAALIISLGLLVDNAVVVSEQILVRLSAGEDRTSAVIGAGKGLLIPLLAASGTTIAAFSPIALAEGSTSEFTYSLFAVVSLTLLSSWILSLTIIPLFCFYFLKPMEKDTFVGRGLTACYGPYEKLLRLVIKLRWAYPLLILFLTVGALYAFRYVPSIFFPPNERGQFIADFELPLGTDIEETERQVKELEDWLLNEKGELVSSVSTYIGNGGPRWYLSLSPEPTNPNYAFLSVITSTEDAEQVAELVEATRLYGLDAFPDATVSPKALETGPPVGDPIQIRLYGPQIETIYALRDQIMEVIESVDGAYGLRDSWGAWVKQVEVDPDPVRAARLGLNTETIAQSLGLQYSGAMATSYREGDKSIPVILRSEADYRSSPERMADVPIFGGPAGTVPLAQVADIKVDFQPGSIRRENTIRMMTIKSKVQGRFASEVLAEIRPLLDDLVSSPEWPQGYHIEYGGEQEESAESQGKIAAVMPISLALLSLILISQFNSIRRYGIIMLTIPPMLIGVTPGLLATGSSFGFMTLLGLIALLGIIVNNAILLIDEINLTLEKENDLVEGIVKACKSRLRPIILTTCTTIIGLMPLALGGGGMWSSMAYAMMFGLGFATALTLLLCPSLFYLFFRREYNTTSPST